MSITGRPHSSDSRLSDKKSAHDLEADDTDTTEKGPDVEPGTPAQTPEDYPEGGLQAWLVVLGTVCIAFSTFGFVNAWGIFQAYYEQELLHDSSPSNIAWIGSIQYALVFLPGLIVGRLFDIGHFRWLFASASVLLIVVTFLIAECTKYWHFILCQGLALGLASGILFAPVNPVISHWFKKRRGLAVGVTAAGSSIGGTVFPIAIRTLIHRVGFPWAMRITGFILIFSMGIANLTVKRRLSPIDRPGGTFNLGIFKSVAFSVYCLSTLFTFLGLYTVLTYIDVSATAVGISQDFSFYLISIANASSGFGRVISGALSDQLGPTNVIMPMTTFAAVLTFAWPFARGEASFIAIAVLYGFGCGTYVALCANPIMAMGDTEDIGRRLGMFFMVSAMGAVAGPPISGAIYTATGGFAAVGYFAGAMIIVAVAFMGVTRHVVLGRLWGKM